MTAPTPSRELSLTEITKCSICWEPCTDPRSLPSCGHTFCLKCLKDHVKFLENEGNDIFCSLCRKQFSVPQDGLDALPKNFTVLELLEARVHGYSRLRRGSASAQIYWMAKSAEAAISYCELCTVKTTATHYCIECDQEVCSTCSSSHMRSKVSRTHNIIDIAEKHISGSITRLRSSYCEEHRDEEVNFYCEDCQMLLCAVCHADEHFGHKSAESRKLANSYLNSKAECRNSMFEKHLADLEDECERFDLQKPSFLEQIAQSEQKLNNKKEELKQSIEAEYEQLKNELIQIKERRLKELDMKVSDAKTELLAWRRFKSRYLDLIKISPDSETMCRFVISLLAEADASLKSHMKLILNADKLDKFEVFFTPAATISKVLGSNVRFIGQVSVVNSIDLSTSQSVSQTCVTISDMFAELQAENGRLSAEAHLLEQRANHWQQETTELGTQIEQSKAEMLEMKEEISMLKKDQKKLSKEQYMRIQEEKKQIEKEKRHVEQEKKQLENEKRQIERKGTNEKRCFEEENMRDADQNVVEKIHIAAKVQTVEEVATAEKCATVQIAKKIKKFTAQEKHFVVHASIDLNNGGMGPNKDVIKPNLEEEHVEEKLGQQETEGDLQKAIHEEQMQSDAPRNLPRDCSFTANLFLCRSTNVHFISNKTDVCGVSAIDCEVFTARDGSSSIEVYNFNDLSANTREFKISASALNSPRIAACPHHRCIYVTDQQASGSFSESIIHRLDLSNNSLTKWTAKGVCEGLFVTSNYTLIATLHYTKRYDTRGRIHEFTTHGTSIRLVILDDSINNPQHCVRTANGNYVVSHSGPTQHRVCLVGATGLILRSYGGTPGSGDDQLCGPTQLAVDSRDHVFVTDYSNNRIRLLSPTLTNFGKVQTPGHRMKQPLALHLDEMNRRLFICERSGCFFALETSTDAS